MPKRTDSNQQEIMDALREIGCTVTSTHTVGKGFPDIVVGWRGVNYLFEIKVPGAKLNQKERDWHGTWLGQVEVLESVEDIIKFIQRCA